MKRLVFATLLLALVSPAWGSTELCTVVDFEEFEPNEIITISKGVAFDPHEYRTYPSDCVGDACPCDDADLSFEGHGNTFIKQEESSSCSPDDDGEGMYAKATFPEVVGEVTLWVGDSEEGTTIKGVLGNQVVWERFVQMGDNESVTLTQAGMIDGLVIECGGSCALDDLTFCPPPPVPTMGHWWMGGLILTLAAGTSWRFLR
jgi:hypothetical protein